MGAFTQQMPELRFSRNNFTNRVRRLSVARTVIRSANSVRSREHRLLFGAPLRQREVFEGRAAFGRRRKRGSPRPRRESSQARVPLAAWRDAVPPDNTPGPRSSPASGRDKFPVYGTCCSNDASSWDIRIPVVAL
jgi:hypothetical protein